MLGFKSLAHFFRWVNLLTPFCALITIFKKMQISKFSNVFNPKFSNIICVGDHPYVGGFS